MRTPITVQLTQLTGDGPEYSTYYEVATTRMGMDELRGVFRREHAAGQHGTVENSLGNEQWLRFFSSLRDRQIAVKQLPEVPAIIDVHVPYSHVCPAAV